MLCILKQTYVHMTRHVDPYIIDKSQFEKLTLNRLESLATIKLIACLGSSRWQSTQIGIYAQLE